MPIGTGADALINVPSMPFSPQQAAYEGLTNRNHFTATRFAHTDGMTRRVQIPSSGILTWVSVMFIGTLVVTNNTGDVDTGSRWPYGLADRIRLSSNFASGVINANGEDLHVHRFISNPAYEDTTDTFVGTVGGGNDLADTAGTPIRLIWQIPVVADRTTQTGALFAQSAQNNLELQIDALALDTLITRTGNATTSLTGEWVVTVDTYDVPRDPQTGGLLTPDLSRLHGLQVVDIPFTSTGEITVPLIKLNGMMTRCFVQVRSAAGTILDPAATPEAWDGLRLEYGGNRTPLSFEPLRWLVGRNNENYGNRVPYGFVVLDFIKENAPRDVVLFSGVTDLRLVASVATGTAIGAGAHVHVVEEVLYA